jgi:alpha-acetolactate decarboxylase
MAKVFSVGQAVEHSVYGLGTISASDTERTTVDFELHGAKKFVTSIVKLEPSEKIPQAPPRRRGSRKAKAAVAQV